MRKFFSVLLVMLLTLGFVMNDAQAKRFGGGRSFGVSRPVSNFSRPQSFATPQRNAAANPWLNRLTGFALGGLLAYLLMGNGLASGVLSWLLVAAAIFFVVSLIRNKMQMASSSNNHYHAANQQPFYNTSSRFMNRNHQTNANDAVNSINFDANKFLQEVKTQFVQLQTAYDQKNFNQLRDLTTPEIFNEIQHQLHERGDTENVTEVVTLDAILLDVDLQQLNSVASVRFSGLIREDFNKAAAAFNEIWHFQQDNNSRWLVAGIQQN